ncbi:hypothetical protein BRC81_12000 [Halobacteriales archaeon QS_1_68_20]|nr:MAG: hypothetical protein BRC81_12000 [Halobacteriales archaeon QS_1_68_20]
MAGSIRMRLADVCFVHWPVDPGEVAAHVPGEETVDTYDGRAWLSVLGMCVRPRFLPYQGAYAQVNVRTYVAGDRPAVHFLDAVADQWLAAQGARTLLGFPARYGSVSVERDGERVDVRCETLGERGFEAALVPTGRFDHAEEGSLADWLVERYRFVRDDGSVGDVSHPPWRLQQATGQVTETELLADLPDPAGDPVFHYSPGVLVKT